MVCSGAMEVRLPSNSAEALQRLADSLQILALTLTLSELESDPRYADVAGAAKRAVDDFARLRWLLFNPIPTAAPPGTTDDS